MWDLARYSIKWKLTLLMTLVCSTVVTLAAMAFVANDVARMRAARIEQVKALADLLAFNGSAALSFQQAEAADELLSSLSSRPNVLYACLYNRDGSVLARYGHGDRDPAPAGFAGHGDYSYNEDGALELTRPIWENGEQIGAIFIRTSMRDLRTQISKDIKFAAVAIFGSLAFSFFLCLRFQGIISEPIVHLTETAQRVTEEHDYSLRAEPRSDDELGILCHEFNNMLGRIQHGEAQLLKAQNQLEDRVIQRTSELARANMDLMDEIRERERAELELQGLHERLVGAARLAGKAEVATSVLHNVGNVLNSVNVSASLIRESMKDSKVGVLQRALRLLQQNSADLPRFLAEDAKGKVLPRYLIAVGQDLENEQQEVAENLESLIANVDHIKTIISMQQSSARISGVVQRVSLARFLDETLQLQANSFERHGIRVTKDYQDVPDVDLDKHRLLEIVVNVLRNARDALLESAAKNRQIHVSLRRKEDLICLEFTDNGAGIHAHDLDRIFTHGFTTKVNGHGFGLHGCANAVKQMGGAISVRSDGPGRGATFRVEMPIVSKATCPQPAVV